MPSIDVVIPPLIHADRAFPHFWQPPKGARLVVYCDGERLRDVVEVDMIERVVRTKHVLEVGGGERMHLKADDGQLLYREYRGRITLDLESKDDLLGYKPIGRDAIDSGEGLGAGSYD